LKTRLAAAGLLFATLLLGLDGIGRSLWLDEAWVANSINAPTLSEMFYYPNWLQSSPPLFLLASRGTVRVLGLSNRSLRVVPLVMALLATLGLFTAATRLQSLPFAALATAILVFFTPEVEYSHTAKQYSGEVAMSSFVILAAIEYLRQPTARRFGWLAAAFLVAVLFSYPSVFLLPGIVLAVYFSNGRRSLLLTALTGAVLSVLYFVFIRPNVAPELRAYWASDLENGFSKGTLAALAAGIVITAFSLARSKGKLGIREWTQLICVAPCILLVIAGGLGWYPVSYRTRLFAVPGFILIIAMAAEDLSRRLFVNRQVTNAMVGIALAATVLLGIRAHIRSVPTLPKEDVAGAVRFLQTAVPSNDLLLVHPSVGETFRLYTAMYGWSAPPVVYGDTGWPCCPRGKDVHSASSTNDAVVRDLQRMIPTGYSGRIWLLYTIRPTHWDWIGADESKLWRSYLADHGCRVSRPNRRFENLAISTAECGESAR
jgi:hypothetical protein